jgi:hypothetical protein
MVKLFLVGVAALAIAASSAVSAQQRPAAAEAPRWQLSQEDIAAFAAARIAALKAGLVLTAEQERNWPAFEAALKDLTRYRADRLAARPTEQPAQDPTERLRRRAEALSGYGAMLKKLADAQEPLYNSLDDAQKRRFAVLARTRRPGAGWHRHGMRDRAGQRGEHRRPWHHRGERRSTSGEERL